MNSFYDFISATIKSILLKWKGSLYVNFLLTDDPTQTPKNTVLDYTYDSVNNKSYFKIPVSTTTNNYALGYDSQYGGNKKAAEELGKLLASKAIEKGIESVVFDRNGFLYHGRVKSFADGARSGGLKF